MLSYVCRILIWSLVWVKLVKTTPRLLNRQIMWNCEKLVWKLKLYDVSMLLQGYDPPEWITFLANLQTNYPDVTLESLKERLEIRPISIWTFTKDILRWFHYLHNDNLCFCSILPLTWLSMKRKCIIYGHSTMAAFISLSLFAVGVNNDQNTHGLLSSFPLPLSASLTRFLYLIPCADDDSEISFSLCLPRHSDKCTHQLRPWGQAL